MCCLCLYILFICVLLCGIHEYVEGEGQRWGDIKFNVALHGQVKPSRSMVVGSAITTLGMARALARREEVGKADIFYSDQYDGLFDSEYDLFLIEGWVPGLWEVLHHIRIRFPRIVVIYYCLDVSYPGLDVILSLPVDGIVSNSPYLVHLLTRLGRAVRLLPLAADVDFMQPRDVGHRDLPFVYVGAGGAMLDEKPMLRAMLETAASVAQTHVWGQGWEAAAWTGFNVTFHGVLDVQDMPLVYSRASAILSAGIEQQELWGMINNRVYEGLACGGVLVHKASEAMRVQFANGSELLLFSSVDELRGMLSHIVVSGEESGMRRRARQAIVTKHSYDHRMSLLMSFFHHLRGERGHERQLQAVDMAQVRRLLQEGASRGLLSPSLDLSLLFPPSANPPPSSQVSSSSSLEHNECLRREGRGGRFAGRVLYVSPVSSAPSSSSFISLDVSATERLLLNGLHSEALCVDKWSEVQLLSSVTKCAAAFPLDYYAGTPLPSSSCPLLSSYDIIVVFLAYAPSTGLHVLDAALRSLPALMSLRGSAQRRILHAPPGQVYPPHASPPLDVFYDVILYRSAYDLARHVNGGEQMADGSRVDQETEKRKDSSPKLALLRYQQLFGLDLPLAIQPASKPEADRPEMAGDNQETQATLPPIVVCSSWLLSGHCTAQQRQQQLILAGARGEMDHDDCAKLDVPHHLLVIVKGSSDPIDDEGDIGTGLLQSLQHPPHMTSLIFLSWNNLIVMHDLLARRAAQREFSDLFSPTFPLVIFMNSPEDYSPSAMSPLLLCGHFGARVHLAHSDAALLSLGSESRGGISGIDQAAFSASLKRALQLAWGLIPTRAWAKLTVQMPISTTPRLELNPQGDVALYGRPGLQDKEFEIRQHSAHGKAAEILRQFHPGEGLDYSYVLWEVKYGGGFLPGRDGRLCLYIDLDGVILGGKNSMSGLVSRCALRAFEYILFVLPSPKAASKWTPSSIHGYFSLRGNLFTNDAYRNELPVAHLAPLPSMDVLQRNAMTYSGFNAKNSVFLFLLS
ncbi:hypothetical protein EON64_02555 [archaeon]|nr:MAG: hypothetical protein EON64_02555 [archaeon]